MDTAINHAVAQDSIARTEKATRKAATNELPKTVHISRNSRRTLCGWSTVNGMPLTVIDGGSLPVGAGERVCLVCEDVAAWNRTSPPRGPFWGPLAGPRR